MQDQEEAFWLKSDWLLGCVGGWGSLVGLLPRTRVLVALAFLLCLVILPSLGCLCVLCTHFCPPFTRAFCVRIGVACLSALCQQSSGDAGFASIATHGSWGVAHSAGIHLVWTSKNSFVRLLPELPLPHFGGGRVGRVAAKEAI